MKINVLALGATWKNMWAKFKSTSFTPKPLLTQNFVMQTYGLWYIKLQDIKTDKALAPCAKKNICLFLYVQVKTPPFCGGIAVVPIFNE